MTGRERRRAAGEVGAVEHNPEMTASTVTAPAIVSPGSDEARWWVLTCGQVDRC